MNDADQADWTRYTPALLLYEPNATHVKFHRPCPECDSSDTPLITFGISERVKGKRRWWCPQRGVFGFLDDKPLFWEEQKDDNVAG